MRIGTWNVEYGFGPRNPDRLALLKTHAADIWVLTETHRDLDLSETHSHVSSEPRPRKREGSTWVTIWSRYPSLQLVPVSDPKRMVAALFDSPFGPLAVAGVVLPWHSDRGDEPTNPPPRNWEKHRWALRDEIPLLLRSLRSSVPAGPCVIAGDFNTDLAAPHSYGVADGRRMLTDLLKKESLTCHTADAGYPEPSPIARTLIDHVCTNLGPAKGIETWSGTDGKQPRLSDHPGVVVTFGAYTSTS